MPGLPASYKRYQRQTILPGFGMQGQQKLLSGRVIVLGAGGLGCPVLQYLAAAGVGTIGIADGDVVALTNLHRQVLFTMGDIGRPKAPVAAKRLQRLNPEISYLVFNEPITTTSIVRMVQGFDVVVDGTDNFATRYLINDACVLLRKPLVFGAISRFEGQVSVFNVPMALDEGCMHYRDLFPHPPQEGEVPNCSESGVLGVLPGIIGSMMANEVIKLLTGLGSLLSGVLLTYDALSGQTNQWQLQKHPDSDKLVPSTVEALMEKDYAWDCGVAGLEMEIDANGLDDLMRAGNVLLVDVREPDEAPPLERWPHIKIPLAELMGSEREWGEGQVVFICQSGKRSLAAANWAKEKLANRKAYSLKGGVLGL